MEYILVGTIIGGIIWGIVVNKVIENKGYEENWFWWGFFFGIFALIVALTKESANTTKVVIEGSAPNTVPKKENAELLSSCIMDKQVNIFSPVHIKSWEIKKDAEKLVLFVDFINISPKAISAIMFSATGFNAFGDKVKVNDAEFFDVIGQDLNIAPNKNGNVYTLLQDEAIRKVEIKVKKVCFADGTITDDIQEEWININQMPLESLHEACAKRENVKAKYYSIIKEHYWQCVCGFVNSENACTMCGMQKNKALKFTKDNIDDIYNEYIKQIEIEKSEEAKRKLEEQRIREEQQAQEEKSRKITAYSTGVIVIIIAIVIILNAVIIPNFKYNKAIKLMDEQKQVESIRLLSEIGGYKDASQIVQNYYKQYRNKISAGFDFVFGVKENGSVLFADGNSYRDIDVTDWENITAVSSNHFVSVVGLKNDGTVVSSKGDSSIAAWKNIVEIGTGDGHIVGLRSDGTVVATGVNDDEQCNVYNWKDIVAISANGDHTVGLRSDGTVVATGDNQYGQCNVSDWRDIVHVASGECYTVGLQEDGTVVAVGDNGDGQCNVFDWSDIVQLAASDSHTVGLKADGTIVAAGKTISVPRNKNKWKNIVAISAGGIHTFGLKADGTLVTTLPDAIDISGWDLIE